MIPVYGFLQGDTIGLLVLTYEDETIQSVIEKLKGMASVRVAPRPGGILYHRERILDPMSDVQSSGFEPLDRIDVRWPLDREGS
jgi:hypothetical protein